MSCTLGAQVSCAGCLWRQCRVEQEQIVTGLRLQPDDVSLDIIKVIDGRRLQEGQYEVMLHFKHATPEKERQIRQYLHEHGEMLSLLGAELEEASATARTTHPGTSTLRPQMPTRMPSHTTLPSMHRPTPPPPRHSQTTSRTQPEHHQPTTVPSTQSTLTTLASTMPTTTTLKPATAPHASTAASTSRPATTLPVLHLQPRGMPHDRQAVIHVLLGVRKVSGSSYAYEMDPTFDLSRREAQLAVVEFCRRLRWEAKLKVVKGQWNCWPSMLKDFLQHRGEQFPTYAIWPAVQRFLAQAPSEADHMGLADDGSVAWPGALQQDVLRLSS
ncbi:Disp1 [Symbiodinium natans]|uniref:Disp1 protein n=1 Tax=Symbiodinium natans TaxID=878477 RepID=A0A812URF0_9DINO|nr:Disp1 [Symbiodinium natans]